MPFKFESFIFCPSVSSQVVIRCIPPYDASFVNPKSKRFEKFLKNVDVEDDILCSHTKF